MSALPLRVCLFTCALTATFTVTVWLFDGAPFDSPAALAPPWDAGPAAPDRRLALGDG